MSKNILVIDDEPAVCKLVEYHLKKEGLEVQTRLELDVAGEPLSWLTVRLDPDHLVAGGDQVASVLSVSCLMIWPGPPHQLRGCRPL